MKPNRSALRPRGFEMPHHLISTSYTPEGVKGAEALRRLEILIGQWTFEGRWPDGEHWAGGGAVTFEWDPSGAHVIERATLSLKNAPDRLCIIGCDATSGRYFQLYSDERGVCRVYEMKIGNGEWILWREGEPFSQRFTGTFSDDGNTITGRWEISEEGSEYLTDFDLVYRRVSAGS